MVAQHINNITNKANSILGLLRRNLRIPSQTIKTHAYQSLVRPHLEYASTVWDPHTQKNIHKLDMIHRRAARYACNRYSNISSVTEMAGHLGWEPLATRRRSMRLCMMYTIAHTVVGDPWTEWLTTTKRVTRGFHAWKYIPIESRYTREKEERTTENQMERCMSTRFDKYWTESGRGDGQGDVEKKDHQSYRRPYMMGKARGKEEEEVYSDLQSTQHL